MNTSALAMNEARARTGAGTGHGLEAIDCSKEYRRGHRRGPVLALRDVSVAFAKPGIYGLLGNNGAGKSTLFRILTNQAFPTAGSARLNGESVTENPAALADVILLDASAPALNDSVRVFFRLTGASHGGFDWQFAKELAGRFSLDLSSRVSSLSTGYRSVARLIACLCANCDYVLLDEPTQGMDAPHRRLFATALMDAYARRPRTIVIASHLISEIEPLVSRVVIINHGRLVAVDSAEALCDKVYRIEGPEEEVDRYARGHGLTVLSRTSIARSASAIVLAGAGQTDGDPGRDAVRVAPSGPAGPDVAVSRVGLQDLFIALTDYDSRHPGTLGGLVGGANAADGSPDMPASSSVRDSRAVIRRSLAAHFGYVLRSWAISFAIFCACLLAAYLVVDAFCAIEGVSGARFSADVPLVIFAAITAAITVRTASFRYLAYGLSRTELAFSLLGLTLLSSLVESCVTVLFMIVPGMLGAQQCATQQAEDRNDCSWHARCAEGVDPRHGPRAVRDWSAVWDGTAGPALSGTVLDPADRVAGPPDHGQGPDRAVCGHFPALAANCADDPPRGDGGRSHSLGDRRIDQRRDARLDRLRSWRRSQPRCAGRLLGGSTVPDDARRLACLRRAGLANAAALGACGQVTLGAMAYRCARSACPDWANPRLRPMGIGLVMARNVAERAGLGRHCQVVPSDKKEERRRYAGFHAHNSGHRRNIRPSAGVCDR